MREKRTVPILIAVLAALTFAPVTSAGPTGLETLFPDAASIDPRMSVEEYQEYGRDALYDYINGGAEVYLDLDFIKVGARDYVIDLGEETWFTVDVYDMSKPENASAIYDAEAHPDAASVEVGDAGYFGGGSLIFRQGRYYVKVRADDDNDAVKEILVKIAGMVSTRISGHGGATASSPGK